MNEISTYNGSVALHCATDRPSLIKVLDHLKAQGVTEQRVSRELYKKILNIVKPGFNPSYTHFNLKGLAIRAIDDPYPHVQTTLHDLLDPRI